MILYFYNIYILKKNATTTFSNYFTNILNKLYSF